MSTIKRRLPCTANASGGGLIVSGIIACPCHLAVTLPLVAAPLAGTALGHFLIHNTGLVYTGATISLVGALALGFWFWFSPVRSTRETNAPCPRCGPAVADERSQEQAPLHKDQPAPRTERSDDDSNTRPR
jgi:mercuric ion transport protein